jgi:hypothetical protein
MFDIVHRFWDFLVKIMTLVSSANIMGCMNYNSWVSENTADYTWNSVSNMGRNVLGACVGLPDILCKEYMYSFHGN